MLYLFIEMIVAVVEGVFGAIVITVREIRRIFSRGSRPQRPRGQQQLQQQNPRSAAAHRARAEYWAHHENPIWQPEPLFNWNYPILRALEKRNSKDYPTEWPRDIQWKRVKH